MLATLSQLAVQEVLLLNFVGSHPDSNPKGMERGNSQRS
jgi:hypothetical protein